MIFSHLMVSHLPDTAPPVTSQSSPGSDRLSHPIESAQRGSQGVPKRSFSECTADRLEMRASRHDAAGAQTCDWICLPSVISAAPPYPSQPERLINTLEAELAALLIRFDFSDGVFPSETIAAYTQLSIQDQQFRLYALAWATAGTDEMSLHLVLQPLAGSYVPLGTVLSVTERDLSNAGQKVRWSSRPVYLYTQILGEWASQFSVKVSFPEAFPVSLSPLMLV